MNKITRDQWGARSPKATPLLINTQSNTCHWEGTSLGPFPHESCATKVQVIQDYHMDHNGWNDIAYNFLVCPHGYVFVGRDHGIRSAANGNNFGNETSEAVCFIGGPGDPFTDAAKAAMAEICNEIGGDTFPHQHWFNTACPGDEILEWINSGKPAPGNPAPPPPNNVGLPPFPLPRGHWFGPPSSDPRNHSGYYNAIDRQYVAMIQFVLVGKAGQDLKGDGFYGAATKQAVLNLQRFCHLKGQDGLTGPETWGLLQYLAVK